jgi:rhodanese-related sulfurtransferase
MYTDHHLIGKKIFLQLGILAAVSALLILSITSIQAGSLDDKQKYERVLAMYNGYSKNFPGVQDISSEEALLLLSDSNVVFIDVRRTDEQKVSMIPGAVTKKDFLRTLEHYRNKRVIAYCTISYRSGKFAEKMGKLGISVTNLRAGLLGWVHAYGPLVRENEPVETLHVYGRKWNLAPSWVTAIY